MNIIVQATFIDQGLQSGGPIAPGQKCYGFYLNIYSCRGIIDAILNSKGLYQMENIRDNFSCLIGFVKNLFRNDSI